MEYFLAAITCFAIAVECGQDKDKQKPTPLHEMTCKYIGEGFDKCENGEVVCYELRPRIFFWRNYQIQCFPRDFGD